MYRILFVDDEPTSKIISQGMADWAKLGLQIIATADNGMEALAFMQSHEVDAVITDLQMPVMDGVSLIHILRTRGFDGPILALSNYSDYNLVRGALTEGAYDYLIKIDCTKEILEKALTQMVSMLNERASRSGNRAEPSETVLEESIQSSLTSYIVNPNAELPEEGELIRLKLPISAYLVEIMVPKARQKNLETFLRPCCSDLFANTRMYFLHISDNEFLILVEDDKPCDVSKKSEVLYRQIKTLLSADALISCAAALSELKAIQRFYRFGSHGNVSAFYGQRTGVVRLYPENTQQDYHRRREDFISSLLSSLRAHDAPAVRTQMEDFVAYCGTISIEPYRIKSAFSILLWCALDIGVLNAEMPAVQELVSVIDGCDTAESLINEVMLFLENNIRFEGKQRSALHPEVAKTLLYIYKNYPSKITLDDISKHVGLCKEYISRLFLKEIGINLFQYIAKVRITKAAEILRRNPTVRIKKVAFDVGFDNPYFFSSKFKDFYGMSPNQYRNIIGGTDDEDEDIETEQEI